MKLTYTDCIRVARTRSGSQQLCVDAGLLRKHLAQQLVEWKQSGWVSGETASRFWRLTRQLARATKTSAERVHADLEEDANALLAESASS